MTGTVENPYMLLQKQAKPSFSCLIKLNGHFHKQPELDKFICIKYVFHGIVTGHACEMLLFIIALTLNVGVEYFVETSVHFCRTS
jgi:hypothetical protein